MAYQPNKPKQTGWMLTTLETTKEEETEEGEEKEKKPKTKTSMETVSE